jgi:predicted alpha/beta superfamily hydrolase
MRVCSNLTLVRSLTVGAVLLLSLCGGLAISQTAAPRYIVLGQVLTLHSDILNQDRPYWVYLPPSYGSSTESGRRFPVLYLLDGGAHFNMVTGVVHHLSAPNSGTFHMPESIIVAIPNMGRTHNMTPVHIDSGAYSENSGGAPMFLDFLRKELMPEIQENYRITQERTIVGHSLAGLFALNVLLTAPETFSHYIAIDPRLFWGDQYLVHQLRAWRAPNASPPLSVYIAQGNSPLSDYEDVSLKKSHEAGIRNFRKLLETRRCKSIRTGFDYFGAETHRSVVLPAVWQGLEFTYKSYVPPPAN